MIEYLPADFCIGRIPQIILDCICQRRLPIRIIVAGRYALFEYGFIYIQTKSYTFPAVVPINFQNVTFKVRKSILEI